MLFHFLHEPGLDDVGVKDNGLEKFLRGPLALFVTFQPTLPVLQIISLLKPAQSSCNHPYSNLPLWAKSESLASPGQTFLRQKEPRNLRFPRKLRQLRILRHRFSSQMIHKLFDRLARLLGEKAQRCLEAVWKMWCDLMLRTARAVFLFVQSLVAT